jgi:16S rRNA (guanine966-N2)-methyltransferase
VLDLFAGTGSLGLEALSRGSEHCTFIERDRRVREILQSNIDLLKLGDRSRVMTISALATGWMATLPRTPLRLVFCDPPYALTGDEKTRPQVLELIRLLAPLMEPGGVCMLRTQAVVDAGPVEGWMEPKRHVYGTMALHFYQTPLPAEA